MEKEIESQANKKHFHVSVRKQVFGRSQVEQEGRARKRESIHFAVEFAELR